MKNGLQLLIDVTVLVLTLDEEDNLERTLASVSWAKNIVVLDSGSSDHTIPIAESFPQVMVLQRDFTSHADQWNFGLDQVKTEWTLAIDADYVFPEEAGRQILLAMQEGHDGYQARFRYLIDGVEVHGSLLPPRTVLFKTKRARYWQDGHTQKLDLKGIKGELPFYIAHDDRKPLTRWLRSQISYARQEAQKLQSKRADKLSKGDRIRKLVVLAPPVVFLLAYVFRGGFISGWRGLLYALQRFTAEMILSLFLIDEKIRGSKA